MLHALISSNLLYFAVFFLGYLYVSILRVQFRYKIVWREAEMIALVLIICFVETCKFKNIYWLELKQILLVDFHYYTYFLKEMCKK